MKSLKWLQLWGSIFLTYDGRMVLIQVVLQSMIAYLILVLDLKFKKFIEEVSIPKDLYPGVVTIRSAKQN